MNMTKLKEGHTTNDIKMMKMIKVILSSCCFCQKRNVNFECGSEIGARTRACIKFLATILS